MLCFEDAGLNSARPRGFNGTACTASPSAKAPRSVFLDSSIERMSDDVLFLASRNISANVLPLPPSIGSDRRVSSATRLIAPLSSLFNDRLGTPAEIRRQEHYV
jgi:hypothetical protein